MEGKARQPARGPAKSDSKQQIDLLSYIDVFRSLAIIGALMVPLALIMRSIDLQAASKDH